KTPAHCDSWIIRTMITRRDWLKRASTALPLASAAWAQSPSDAPSAVESVNGVRLGVETFSYHDLPPAGDARLIPTLIDDMRSAGLVECEIMSGHVEPMGSYATGWWVATRRAAGYAKMREDARKWRLTVPMDYYRNVRRQFEDAGL